MEYVREDLGMVNKHLGYVYLVDEMCRVRWAGGADAMVEEAMALEKCTGILLDRLDGKMKAESAGNAEGGDVPSQR
jgi:ATPase complex subunit ATP10